MTAAYDSNGNKVSYGTCTDAQLLDLTFDCEVSITFTKELYYHNNSNNTLYEVWPGLSTGQTSATDGNLTAMAMIDALGGTARRNVTFMVVSTLSTL